MKLETFFEKFGLFADAPDAVAKMRKLVLKLAVQGQLVEQMLADGDADALLKLIISARKKNGRGKLSAKTETEEMTEIDGWHQVPVSWRWVRLGTIGDIVGGGTPRSDNPAYFTDEGIPWLTPADLNGFKAKKIHRGRRCITKAGLENSSAQLLPVGSVLFSSRAPIGYVAIAGCELATNQGFKSCVPFLTELNEFLYYYLISVADRIDREASGTTFREVSGKIVSQIPVPLPPLAEQKRIVAKVDELMAVCDLLEAQQNERETRKTALACASLARFADAPNPANLDFIFHNSYDVSPADLRKTILTLAVQGKLVPQDPNDGLADELHQSIIEEQERLVKARLIRRIETTSLADEDEPFAIPSSWVWTRMGKIGDWGSGSTPPRGNHELYGGSIPWLKSGELNDNKNLIGSEETVTELALKSSSFRFNKPGDVLLAMYGATIGKAAILAQEAVTNQAVCGCTPFPGVLNTYLFHYLLSQRDEFHAVSEGGAQPNISKVKIVGYPFPLPPLAEQRRIVAKVEQLMTLVDELETQLATSQATGQSLLAALIVELTTGKEPHATT